MAEVSGWLPTLLACDGIYDAPGGRRAPAPGARAVGRAQKPAEARREESCFYWCRASRTISQSSKATGILGTAAWRRWKPHRAGHRLPVTGERPSPATIGVPCRRFCDRMTEAVLGGFDAARSCFRRAAAAGLGGVDAAAQPGGGQWWPGPGMSRKTRSDLSSRYASSRPGTNPTDVELTMFAQAEFRNTACVFNASWVCIRRPRNRPCSGMIRETHQDPPPRVLRRWLPCDNASIIKARTSECRRYPASRTAPQLPAELTHQPKWGI